MSKSMTYRALGLSILFTVLIGILGFVSILPLDGKVVPDCDTPSVESRWQPASKGSGFVDKVDRNSELSLAWKIYNRNLQRRRFFFDPQSLGTHRERELYVDKRHMLFFGCPLYPCFGEERVGNWGDGGKWICRPFDLKPSSVVYSVGSNGQIDFERSLFKLTGASSHCFDPTLSPGVERNLSSKRYLHFHALGLTGSNPSFEMTGGAISNSFNPRFERIMDVMKRLKHRYVDILKIDCEGCEIDVFADVFDALGSYNESDPARRRVLFGQVLVEYHTVEIPRALVPSLAIMEKLGYLMFHVEQNYICGECIELAYIHRSLVVPRMTRRRPQKRGRKLSRSSQKKAGAKKKEPASRSGARSGILPGEGAGSGALPGEGAGSGALPGEGGTRHMHSQIETEQLRFSAAEAGRESAHPGVDMWESQVKEEDEADRRSSLMLATRNKRKAEAVVEEEEAAWAERAGALPARPKLVTELDDVFSLADDRGLESRPESSGANLPRNRGRGERAARSVDREEDE